MDPVTVKYPPLHLVLVHPQIPPNTGNIARLCACNHLTLHLVHPLGFSLSSKHLERAGMDYFREVDLLEHTSWQDYLKGSQGVVRYFFSARATSPHWSAIYETGCHLIFGSETNGLPPSLWKKYPNLFYTIPMGNPSARSLNLSSAVSVVAYEALRQITDTGT